MPGISKELLASQEARLWKVEGEAEICRRIRGIEKRLLGSGELKRLPAILGIKRVSLYGILKGTCSYNLFYRQIGPAAIARQQRLTAGAATEDDKAIEDSDWKTLDLMGLVSKFAPSLLQEKQASVPINEVYPVAQKLVEDVIPTLTILSTAMARAIQNANSSPKSINRYLQQEIDGFSFPAGFSATETRPEILGCNQALLDLLGVPHTQVVGQTLNDLFGMILQRVPANVRGSTIELLQQRIGARRISDTERDPFCFQFYLDKRGAAGPYSNVYLVTTLAFDLSLLNQRSIAVFAYHVRAVSEVP